MFKQWDVNYQVVPVDLTHIVQGLFTGIEAINIELFNNNHSETALGPVR